jgi:hypothetical protein
MVLVYRTAMETNQRIQIVKNEDRLNLLLSPMALSTGKAAA